MSSGNSHNAVGSKKIVEQKTTVGPKKILEQKTTVGPKKILEQKIITEQNNKIGSQNTTEQQNSDSQNIIDADKFMAITLDDISFKLSQLTDIFTKNQQTLLSLLDYTIRNEKRLAVIEEQLLAEADNGQFVRTSGVVTTSRFVIIDTNASPGHMVKGYTVKNDGPNIIFVAHNAAVSSELDVDIMDVTSNTSRFEEVLPNEDIKFIFNRRTIRNVHILSHSGDSNFRAWITW